MFLGAHMPTVGGVSRALERGAEVGCEIVQIFVKSNHQWFGKPFAKEELARFATHRAAKTFRHLFAHAGYLINLGALPSPKRDLSVKSLIEEVRLAASLDLPFVVMHPGAHIGCGELSGLRNAVAGLKEVFRATCTLPVRIALEITAGQGTCLGYKIEHLAAIYDKIGNAERLGVCLDTAHLFAAGYDIRSPQQWDRVMQEIDGLIGLKEILAIHLNDSATELGSRVDRHAGIGKGKIGREAFRHIVNDARLVELPGCLETPKSPDLHEDVENLAILRSLVG